MVVAMATTNEVDLTDFGFTQTENAVYFQLLARGPSSGYALARELSMARANAYQALRGLVVKGAAVLAGDHPQRFRAVRPEALHSRIVEEAARKLDELGKYLTAPRQAGADVFVPISGERALVEVVARAAALESGPITCVASSAVLAALVPVLRKRAAEGAKSTIWAVGNPPALPVPIQGAVSLDSLNALFGSPAAIVLAGEAAVLACLTNGEMHGYWATDPCFRGAARAVVAAVTGAGPA